MEYKPNKLTHFLANIVAMFVPGQKNREKIRNLVYRKEHRERVAYEQIKQHWRNIGDNLMPARFDKYDVIFGISSTCAAAWLLKYFGLRDFANPFDWTVGETPPDYFNTNVLRDSRFMEKINAISTEFQDWFEYDDFCPANAHYPEKHQEILNKKHKIKYLHLFPQDQSWQMYFPTARETIMRRGARLIDAISKSKRVLIVWETSIFSHKNLPDAPVSDDEIKRALKILQRKFPHQQFDLVFFEHDGTLGQDAFKKIAVCDGAYRIISNHFITTFAYDYVRQDEKKSRLDVPTVIGEMMDNLRLKK